MSLCRVWPSEANGEINAPPSKTYTHRAFFAALLAGERVRVLNPLYSDDTYVTLDIVKSLGAQVEVKPSYTVIEVPSRELAWKPSLYCRESGTTIRFATAIASLLDRPILLYGEEGLNRRPIAGLLRALGSLGVEYILSRGCCPPHSVKGPVRGSTTTVDAWESSQYLSALLLLGVRLDKGLVISVARISSRGYVDATIDVLREFGARIKVDNNYRLLEVEGPLKPIDYSVPSDWSSIATILVAGAISGKVKVKGNRLSKPHPDRRIVDILSAAGVKIRVGEEFVIAEKPRRLEPIDICIDDCPDLAPLASVIAMIACGESKICCVERLVYKESDRATAIINIAKKIGAYTMVREESGKKCIVIRGRCGSLSGGVVLEGFNDHRIVFAAALLGLVSERPIGVTTPYSVSKSYPGFWNDLANLGVRVECK